ncbi:hypothetical protein M9Y10_022966 [Tritrichomonas musculus]|uniref:Uncharacterized protein n=1 Tax=Tritrichomonas musculus TaxID=1915356 RepID=A0ABR2KTT6_9EUKA
MKAIKNKKAQDFQVKLKIQISTNTSKVRAKTTFKASQINTLQKRYNEKAANLTNTVDNIIGADVYIETGNNLINNLNILYSNAEELFGKTISPELQTALEYCYAFSKVDKQKDLYNLLNNIIKSHKAITDIAPTHETFVYFGSDSITKEDAEKYLPTLVTECGFTDNLYLAKALPNYSDLFQPQMPPQQIYVNPGGVPFQGQYYAPQSNQFATQDLQQPGQFTTQSLTQTTQELPQGQVFIPQGQAPTFAPQNQTQIYTSQNLPQGPTFTPQNLSQAPVFTPQSQAPQFTPQDQSNSPVFTPQGQPPQFTPPPQNTTQTLPQPPVFTPPSQPQFIPQQPQNTSPQPSQGPTSPPFQPPFAPPPASPNQLGNVAQNMDYPSIPTFNNDTQ